MYHHTKRILCSAYRSFNCGIMISASHNPYYDNGIKVINEKGEKLEESVITEIEKYLDGEIEEIPFAKKDKIGRTVDFAAGRNRYIGYLISIATRSFKNMKVALDCANEALLLLPKMYLMLWRPDPCDQ